MTTSAYQLEIDGVEAVRRSIADVGQRSRNMRPAFRKVAHILQQGQAKQFSTQGSYLGETWAPNAPATMRRKEIVGDPTPLVDTGALKAAAEGRGRGKVRRITKTQVTVGVSVFHARFHQGSSGHEPRRRIVGVHPRDRARAVRAVRDHLTRGL